MKHFFQTIAIVIALFANSAYASDSIAMKIEKQVKATKKELNVPAVRVF